MNNRMMLLEKDDGSREAVKVLKEWSDPPPTDYRGFLWLFAVLAGLALLLAAFIVMDPQSDNAHATQGASLPARDSREPSGAPEAPKDIRPPAEKIAHSRSERDVPKPRLGEDAPPRTTGIRGPRLDPIRVPQETDSQRHPPQNEETVAPR